MLAAVFIVLSFITLVSAKFNHTHFQGCVSSSFVEQYAFYYKFHQPLPLKDGVAACDHRLTRYIGLQVDKSTPDFYNVYCGNDLLEMSPKLEESRCQPCLENGLISCGGDDTMAVYSLRESTPLAILMVTSAGVEILIDNDSILLVAYNIYFSKKYIDYIYTEDSIFLVTQNSLKKLYFNTLGMKFSQPYSVSDHPNRVEGLAVDFSQNDAFWGYDLVKTNLKDASSTILMGTVNVPSQISVDPYNRSLVFFLELPATSLHIYLLDKKTYAKHNLHYLNIQYISTFTLEINEKLVYAIVTLQGDLVTCFVKINYELTQKHVLFTAPQLTDAKVLEVFRENAVWLGGTDSSSTIYMCKLVSGCRSGDIKSYTTSQTIYDFTIFHPEKQTPGEKWLCSNLTCQYGCKASSLFSASCSCPPGMELNVADNRCYELPPTTSATAISDYGISTYYADVINSSLAPSTTKVNPPEDIKEHSGLSFNEAFIVICIVFILLVQIVMCVLFIYRKKSPATSVQVQCHELNEYVEIPFLK